MITPSPGAVSSSSSSSTPTMTSVMSVTWAGSTLQPSRRSMNPANASNNDAVCPM